MTPFNCVMPSAMIGAGRGACSAAHPKTASVSISRCPAQEQMEQRTAHGRIFISSDAIASIVSRTVLEGYGVVGMASRHLRDGIAEVLHRDVRNKGVDVRVVNGKI